MRGGDEPGGAHHLSGFRFHPSLSEGLLSREGSDKLERCWRRHLRNPPVTDWWLWISTTGNDEVLF